MDKWILYGWKEFFCLRAGLNGLMGSGERGLTRAIDVVVGN